MTAVDRYFADRCPQLAAGIAYRVLFSIVPLAIVIVSIFGLVLGNQEVNDVVVDTITRALPSTAASRQDVADAITAIASPSGVLGLITLVLFAWAATGMMASIRAGLEVAFHVEHSRPMARGKLVDLALVVGTAVLVLGMAGLTLLDRLAQHTLRRVGLGDRPPGDAARDHHPPHGGGGPVGGDRHAAVQVRPRSPAPSP